MYMPSFENGLHWQDGGEITKHYAWHHNLVHSISGAITYTGTGHCMRMLHLGCAVLPTPGRFVWFSNEYHFKEYTSLIGSHDNIIS